MGEPSVTPCGVSLPKKEKVRLKGKRTPMESAKAKESNRFLLEEGKRRFLSLPKREEEEGAKRETGGGRETSGKRGQNRVDRDKEREEENGAERYGAERRRQ